MHNDMGDGWLWVTSQSTGLSGIVNQELVQELVIDLFIHKINLLVVSKPLKLGVRNLVMEEIVLIATPLVSTSRFGKVGAEYIFVHRCSLAFT